MRYIFDYLFAMIDFHPSTSTVMSEANLLGSPTEIGTHRLNFSRSIFCVS